MNSFRLAVRGLRRSPGFTAIGILLLALGTGAATLVFAIVDAVLLRPLPYESPDRLAAVFTVEGDRVASRNPSSPANYIDLRDGIASFEQLVAARVWSPTVTGAGEPERLDGILSTAGLFELLGVPALRGRTFDSTLDADAAVAVIGYGLWSRRYGRDENVIGRSILLDGESHTIIGVMPDGFRFPPFWATSAEIWVPLRMPPEEWSRRAAAYLRLFGRLADGADVARASAEADAIASRLTAEHPETNASITFRVEPLREPAVADSRTALIVLSGAVVLLLLIASANLTNLLLGRVLAARRDTAVRIALGAGRVRLLRQWLAESAVLAAAGALGGLLLAAWSLQGLLAIAADALPAFRQVTLGFRGAGFAVGAALATGLLAGLLPARRALSGDVFAGLRGRGTGAAMDGRARTMLASAEVALATTLLIGAALLTRSFLFLTHVEPGFETEGVVTASIALGNGRYQDVASQERLVGQVVDRIGARSGVERVGAINHLPIGGDTWTTRFALPGDGQQFDIELPRASYRVADAGYFETLRIPLVRGRLFDERDTEQSPRVALVNRTLADRYFPGTDPVGTLIRFGGDGETAPLVEIVGIVGDVRAAGVAEDALAELFLPRTQNPEPWFTFVTLVARSADPAGTGRAIAGAVAEIDPALPVYDLRPLGDVLANDLRGQRLNFLLTALFAGGALVLSVIGVYAVISQLTRQRSHELAVRLALGADPRGVLGLVVRRGVVLAGAGVAAGVLVAAVVARPVSSLLFGVTAWDAPTYGGVAILMTMVCAAASTVPALRAARTDPVATLTHD